MSILLNILLMVAGLKITFKTADIDRFYSCDENEQLDRDPCHFLHKNLFFLISKGDLAKQQTIPQSIFCDFDGCSNHPMGSNILALEI